MGLLSDHAVGAVGLVLYGSLSLVALWRLFVHLIPYNPPIYATRKMFHVLILLYAVFETLYQMMMFTDNSAVGKACYALHIVGIWCEVTAISLVLILWSKTLLSREVTKSEIIPIVFLFNGGFLCYIFLVVGHLSVAKESFDDWLDESDWYKYLLIVEPCALAFNGIGMLFYGLKISQRLTKHPAWAPLPASHKSKILTRLKITIAICFVCFCLRAAFELYLFITFDTNAKGVSEDVWWIFATWMPTLIPAALLLYTLRRPDVAPQGGMAMSADHENLDANGDSFGSHNFIEPLVRPASHEAYLPHRSGDMFA